MVRVLASCVRKPRVSVITIAAMTAMLAGCTGGSEPLVGHELVDDEYFSDRFEAAYESSTPVRVDELTNFDWTTVSVFIEGTDPEFVAEELGVDLLERRYRASAVLWVFCADGEVAKVVAGPPIQFSMHHTYSHDARIDDALRPNTWALNEPDGSAVLADCS